MAVRSMAAEIEEATAAALAGLPASWQVVRDPVWPGNQFPEIDHIVVGPPGIFVIDSRTWSAQDGLDRNALIRTTAEAAVSVSGLATSVRFDYVHGVICIPERNVGIRWVGGVLICSTAELVAELTSYVEVIPGGVGKVVAAHIEKRLKDEAPARRRPKPVKAPTPAKPATVRRRRTPTTAAVAAMLAGFAVVLAVAPSVVSTVPGEIAQLIDDATNDNDNPFDGKTPKPPVVKKKKKDKPARHGG